MDHDSLDDLLGLEDKFYNEGFNLGLKDGQRAGLIEGRFFGLEKGFEKYTSMGMLYGRSVVWASRLPEKEKLQKTSSNVNMHANPAGKLNLSGSASLPELENPRLEKHIRTLYALSEPGSLATDNSEEAVADFDDRFRRAEGKAKIIQKLIGEDNFEAGDSEAKGGQLRILAKQSKGIEDIDIAPVRR